MEANDDLKGLSARSEEVQDLMGNIPHWILRWGIFVMAVIVGGILIGSYFIQIQQTLPIHVTVVNNIRIDSVIAIADGTISSVQAENAENVSKNSLVLTYLDKNGQTYPSLAPIEGTLSFPYNRTAGTKIRENEVLFYIEGRTRDVRVSSCFGYVTHQEMVQLEVGQKAYLNLSSTDSDDMVHAQIASISPLPNSDGQYYVSLYLSQEEKMKLSAWMKRPQETMEARVEIASYRLMDEILRR